MGQPERALLEALFRAGVAAASGRAAVRRALGRRPPPPGMPLYLAAVGKAAAAMAQGALDVLQAPPRAGLVIVPHGDPSLRDGDLPWSILSAGHPMPDEASLGAGRALADFVAAVPPDGLLLLLVSGGASALVEVLPTGVVLDRLRELNAWLLASGHPIGTINRIRQRCSMIKGGRLAGKLRGQARVLLMSDVSGDDPAVIGSGLMAPAGEAPLNGVEVPAFVEGWMKQVPPAPAPGDVVFTRIEHEVVASLRDALQGVEDAARRDGLAVHRYAERLAGDAAATGTALARLLLVGEPGVHLWGGETTVRLPESPGEGGRCQQLALAAALALAGVPGVALLAAGTDGRDGPGEAAGAVVDGTTVARARSAGCAPEIALARADAATCLGHADARLVTGPTGTNVNDLVIGLKMP